MTRNGSRRTTWRAATRGEKSRHDSCDCDSKSSMLIRIQVHSVNRTRRSDATRIEKLATALLDLFLDLLLGPAAVIREHDVFDEVRETLKAFRIVLGPHRKDGGDPYRLYACQLLEPELDPASQLPGLPTLEGVGDR